MPGAHAMLSPSSADRWMTCPGSTRLIAQLPPGPEEDSVYAREGTIAHALGELEAAYRFKITDRKQYLAAKREWTKEFNAQGYPAGTLDEMQGYVHQYVELLAERLKRYPHSRLFLEQRMDSGVPGSWGTSDAVIVSPQHIEIIDLKYGAGLAVYPVGNRQLSLYACGALDTYGDLLGDTEKVFITVFQPRVDNSSTDPWELTPEELRAWRTEEAIPAAEQANDPDAPLVPSEKACKWCPAAAICRTRVEVAVAQDFGDPFVDTNDVQPPKPELLSPEEIAHVLHRLPQIRAWADAVEAHALDQAYSQGKQIPGWKVVRSAGRRSISDHAGAIQTLIDMGFKAEQVAKPFQAKGIGELEKLVGKKQFTEKLGQFISKSTGKESLVTEDHPSPAISPLTGAKDEFTTIQGELL